MGIISGNVTKVNITRVKSNSQEKVTVLFGLNKGPNKGAIVPNNVNISSTIETNRGKLPQPHNNKVENSSPEQRQTTSEPFTVTTGKPQEWLTDTTTHISVTKVGEDMIEMINTTTRRP